MYLALSFAENHFEVWASVIRSQSDDYPSSLKSWIKLREARWLLYIKILGKGSRWQKQVKLVYLSFEISTEGAWLSPHVENIHCFYRGQRSTRKLALLSTSIQGVTTIHVNTGIDFTLTSRGLQSTYQGWTILKKIMIGKTDCSMQYLNFLNINWWTTICING